MSERKRTPLDLKEGRRLIEEAQTGTGWAIVYGWCGVKDWMCENAEEIMDRLEELEAARQKGPTDAD